MLNPARPLFLILLLVGFSCKARRQSSDVKITSTLGQAYEADLLDVEVDYDPRLFLGDTLFEGKLQDYEATDLGKVMIQASNEIAVKLHTVYASGQFKNQKDSGLAVNDLEIKSANVISKDLMRITYSAKLIYFERARKMDSKGTEIWLPKEMSKSSVENMVQYRGCFMPEISTLLKERPEGYHFSVFYYFNPNGSGCSSDVKAKYFSKLALSPRMSPENPERVKYPEYQKIWKDSRLVASLAFTPAESLTNKDHGVQAYINFIRLVVGQYGTPNLGTVPAPLLSGPPSSAPALQYPEVSFGYNLADGRQLVFNLVLGKGDFSEGSKFLTTLSNFAKESDYLSYNGHAAYGMNIRALEKAIAPADGNHLLFYINGCSTFNYVGPKIFQSSTADGVVSSKDIDILTNLLPGYFDQFASANFKLIQSLMEQKSSYIEIVSEIEKSVLNDKNPILVVRGEENNVGFPKK